MKNYISWLFLTAIFCSCSQKDGVRFLETGYDQILARAEAENKLVMLYFWSDG